MSHRVFLRTAAAPVGILPSSGKGKEEDNTISREEPPAPIDLLPDDVLSLIFDYATNGCRNGNAFSAIRAVEWKWFRVLDTCNLRSNWGNLQKEIKSPSLRDLVGQIVLVDRFVSELLASAIYPDYDTWISSDQVCLINKIEYMGPSWFSRFAQLTQSLREKGAPILLTHAVLGLEFSSYENMQQRLDTALETIWTRIQQQIDFEGAPIPHHADAIRAWLNNSVHADKIARVTRLDLSRLNLTVLPPEIGNFSQLKWFFVYDNQLTSLPDTMGKLSQLIELSFNHNQLTSLPDTIGELSQLAILNLATNQLRSVPETVGKLSELRELFFDENQVTSVPEAIGKLVQLTNLSFSKNQLTCLPETIGNLSKLKTLAVFDNQLTSLPETIGNLSELVTILFKGNQLTSLPETIGNLSKVLYYCISANRLIFNLDKDFREFDANSVSVSRTVIERFSACSGYRCNTPLASLCQHIHLGREDDVISNVFLLLSDEMKERIRGAWAAFPTSSSSSSEAGADLFADRAIFAGAVIKAIQDKWQSLSQDQRNQVYARVAILAGRPQAGALWGEVHAWENIIRLIDAMELTV